MDIGTPLGWFLGGIIVIGAIGLAVWMYRKFGPEVKKDLKDTIDDLKGNK